MWQLLASLINRRAESAEISRLKMNLKESQVDLAQRDEVEIPALKREIELEKRVNEIYASRVEREAKWVEVEMQKFAGRIAEVRM